jgi:hypothetical protein
MSHELRQFRKDGFYIAKGLLDVRAVDFALNSISRSFGDQLPFHLKSVHADCFSNMQALFTFDLERYKRTAAAVWRKHDIFHLMHHSTVTEFLIEKFGYRDLFLPGGQVVFIMADKLAVPGGYFGLTSHQDYWSVQGSLDGVVVWIPLVDVDKETFPLEVVPQSHLRGVLPLRDPTYQSPEIASDHLKENDFLPIEVQRGDVVFMTLFTVHRSSLKGTAGKFRVALSTRFDNGGEQTYIDRSYPTAYIRNVHREPLIEGFPSNELVKSLFRSHVDRTSAKKINSEY